MVLAAPSLRPHPRKPPARCRATRQVFSTTFALSLAVAAVAPAQRCWQSVPSSPEHVQVPLRRTLLAAGAAAASTPGSGIVGAEETEEEKEKEGEEKSQFEQFEEGITERRKEQVNPDDLKRGMPDADFFKAVSELTPLQRLNALEGRDEGPFQGVTVNGYKWDTQAEGVYVSAISGKQLFSSAARYDAGDGQLSFSTPLSADTVIEREDYKDVKRERPVVRIQVLDRISKTHLGHVYGDGPKPSGKRYKINASALRFLPGPAPAADVKQALAGWKMD